MNTALKDGDLNFSYKKRDTRDFFFFFYETRNTQKKSLQTSRNIASYVSERKSLWDGKICMHKTICKEKYKTSARFLTQFNNLVFQLA